MVSGNEITYFLKYAIYFALLSSRSTEDNLERIFSVLLMRVVVRNITYSEFYKIICAQ